MLYIDTGHCYMYSSIKRRDNANRLPPLPGRTSRRCAQEKGRAHSISPSRDRSSAELRAESQDIWKALGNEGLQMSYHGFHKAVWRAERKRKPTAASGCGKQDKPSEAQGLRETKVDTVDGRDPFANLRRLEPENRPGFHWRGTRSVKTSAQGMEDSNAKNKL